MQEPKGKLIPVGGKEARSPEDENKDKPGAPGFFSDGILHQILIEMKGPESRIEVVTTASEIPDEMGEMYCEAFGRLGCRQVNILNLDGRNVDSKNTLRALGEADGVFFTGGDQVRLLDRISETRFMQILKDRYQHDDFVVAGTSAGAMAMSEITIREGSGTESLVKGIVEVERGFTLLPQTIIDTHFMSRGRFARLAEALLMNPGYIALGICEDTGLVVEKGDRIRTIGSGVVMLLETSQIRETNFRQAKKLQPVYVEGMSIHILAAGAGYSLKDKKFLLQHQKQR